MTEPRTYAVESEYEMTLSGGRTVEEWVRACRLPGESVTVRDKETGEVVFETDDPLGDQE